MDILRCSKQTVTNKLNRFHSAQLEGVKFGPRDGLARKCRAVAYQSDLSTEHELTVGKPNELRASQSKLQRVDGVCQDAADLKDS